MAENKVAVEITLEEKAALKALTQLSREVQKTEGSFKKMGDQGDESMGVLSEASQGLSNGFKSLVGGVTVANLASDAIIGTANAVKNFVIGSVNAAVEQQNAINRVSQALRSSGEFSEAAIADFDAFSDALEKNSLFAGDVALSQIALAKSMGATNEQAKQLVQAAANLSATFGGSLEERVAQLGQSLGGTAGRLTKFIPELKNFTEEQLRSGQAIELVNSKFSGAAAAAVDTYQGRVAQLTNSMGKLQEELGNLVIESDLVQGGYSFLGSLFQEIAQELKNFNLEVARGKEGFEENQETVNQLSVEYETLTRKIEEARAVIAVRNDPNSGFFESLFANAERAKEQLAELIPLQQKLANQINAAQASVQVEDAASRSPGASGSITPQDQKLIDSRAQANIALQQSYIEQAAWEAEQDLLKREITAQNYAAELEQLQAIEQEKINIRFAAEEQKAQAIQDAQTRQATLLKLGSDKELAIEKSKADAKKKIDDAQLKQQQESNKQTIDDERQFFAAATSLASSKNKELAAIGVASGLTQIAVATPPAIASSYKFGAALGGPVLGAAFGSIAAAAQAAQAARLSGLKFNYGGIVPGASATGDRVPAMVNSGEMILNRSQQSELFNIANGGGGSSSVVAAIDKLTAAIANQPIQVMIDKRKIAEAVRGEIQNGFRLT